MLLIAIIRTISTNPGNIPDHKEWDMSTDTSAGEESVAMMSATTGPGAQDGEQGESTFTNKLIEKQQREPREVVHEDLKYLKTTEGPLVNAPRGSASQQAGAISQSDNKKGSLMRVSASVERKRYGGVRIC